MNPGPIWARVAKSRTPMDTPIHEVERSLLRLICLETTDAQLRTEVMAHLRGYAFRSVEHQALFDCLREMPVDRPELLRELLPARLVRAGFPDFDLAPFVASPGGSSGESPGKSPQEPHALSPHEARELCRALTGADSAEGIAAAGKQPAGMARGEQEPAR